MDATPETTDSDSHMLSWPGPDPERQAYAAELRQLLEAAIDSLPEHYRMVFVLRQVEGLSTGETAECLQLGEEAVKTRLHRARTLLREDLNRRAGIAAPEVYTFHLSRCDRVVAGVFDQLGLAV